MSDSSDEDAEYIRGRIQEEIESGNEREAQSEYNRDTFGLRNLGHKHLTEYIQYIRSHTVPLHRLCMQRAESAVQRQERERKKHLDKLFETLGKYALGREARNKRCIIAIDVSSPGYEDIGSNCDDLKLTFIKHATHATYGTFAVYSASKHTIPTSVWKEMNDRANKMFPLDKTTVLEWFKLATNVSITGSDLHYEGNTISFQHPDFESELMREMYSGVDIDDVHVYITSYNESIYSVYICPNRMNFS